MSARRNATAWCSMIGFAEALALTGIVAGRFERGAGHAHRLRGNADAPAFEVGQGDPVAFALFTQAIGHRHFHLFEENLAGVRGMLAELVLDPRRPGSPANRWAR